MTIIRRLPSWRVVRQLSSAFWQTALAYRGNMIIRSVHAFLMPSILLLVWLSVKRTPSLAYNDQDFTLYYLLMPLIMNLTGSYIVHELPEEIRDGTLSRHLLKPVHPLILHVIKHLTVKWMLFLQLVPVVTVLVWALRSYLPPLSLTPALVIGFMALLLNAMFLRFAMGLTLALTGFWIEHVETLNLVLNAGIWAIFGGMVVPVETMSGPLRTIAELLPYRYSLSFPLEILRGVITPPEILFGVLVSLAWGVFFVTMIGVLWRRGLRVYSAYGG
jgi:ABC-2 type transport system permease protein